MSAERMNDNEMARRLTRVLEIEADAVPVTDTWDDLANRLLVDVAPPTAWSVSVTWVRRRRGVLVGIGVAAAIVLVVLLGWRPASLTVPPVVSPATDVPRYDASIPTLVVYRTTAGVYNPSDPTPTTDPLPKAFTLTPERMRTDSPDVGRAALVALIETPPVQPGNTRWVDQLLPQKIDVASVRVSGGLIRVELNDFYSAVFTEPEAHVMAQAWVRTLQDTLGVRDDVSITLRGKPFWLYYAVDTTSPLTRDESIPVVRPDGFDSPRNGDVVPGTFVLLGSVATDATRPGRVEIVDLDTGAIAYRQEIPGPVGGVARVDFAPVLTLDPGRYRAVIEGDGAVRGIEDVTFTVVA